MLTRSALLAACLTTASAFAPSGFLPRAADSRGVAISSGGGVALRPTPARSPHLSMQLLGPDGKPMGSGGGGGAGFDSKDPKACKALVDGGHVYLDVRTDDEVSQGAPVDCVNVPAFARTDDGMMPMSSTFLKLVTENFPDKDVNMVVGCASGNRSKNACAWLVEAGYTNVVENAEGFTGWKAKGLPYKVAGSNAIF